MTQLVSLHMHSANVFLQAHDDSVLIKTMEEQPWVYCVYSQVEFCEPYLPSIADDIFIIRIHPRQYDYHRVVLSMVNHTSIITQESKMWA